MSARCKHSWLSQKRLQMPNSVFLWPGSVTFVNPVAFPDGTSGAPSITFASDPTMGLYRSGANSMVYAANSGSPLIAFTSNLTLQSGGKFQWSSTTSPLGSTDLFIVRDAPNTFALMNGTSPQEARFYRTFTDASNYGRLSILATGTDFQIAAQQAGTGGTSNLKLFAATGGQVFLGIGTTSKYGLDSSGNFVAASDNTLDIGASGANRPRTIYVGTSINSPSYSLALTTAQPVDQTGNATATLLMNGLGSAAAPATITPTSTGRVVFTVTGDLTNSTILDGVTYKLVYGTGSAPANGAAASGTAISATRSVAVAVAAQKQGFSVTGSATGLALATAVWYDLQIANVSGGTASVSNITVSANEI